MRTPIAMTASKGWEGMVATLGAGVEGRLSPRERREFAPPMRSVAVVLAWICEAEITLDVGVNEGKVNNVDKACINGIMTERRRALTLHRQEEARSSRERSGKRCWSLSHRAP